MNVSRFIIHWCPGMWERWDTHTTF